MDKLYGHAEEVYDNASEWYAKHVEAMTREQLHSKSDIAYELAYRDMQNQQLRERLAELTEVLRVIIRRDSFGFAEESSHFKCVFCDSYDLDEHESYCIMVKAAELLGGEG